MWLGRIKHQKHGGRGFIDLAAASEFRSAGFGDGDHQGFMAMRRVVVSREIGAQATQARQMRVIPVSGGVAAIDAGQDCSPPSNISSMQRAREGP
jgi:hypothetical protein